jgi:Zn finger protein HypA/HybF involved in hydrogenase expression
MSNHRTHAAWPVKCNQCKEVTTANFESQPLSCEECHGLDVIPYTDKNLSLGDGENGSMLHWGNLNLTNGRYCCPRCGKYELKFSTNASGRHARIGFD